jgi:hypothetical protein
MQNAKQKKKLPTSKANAKRGQRQKAEEASTQMNSHETLESDTESGVVNPALNWPQNRSKSRRTRAEERSNLFPFEKDEA